MTKVKVVARGSRINVSAECLNVETVKEARFCIGGFEVFLSARGKGKEIERLNNAINETKALLKIAKESGIKENYYSLSKQLKLLKERKRELEKIPEEELDEVVVEFVYEQNQLKLVYNGKTAEIDDVYQDLFLASDLTSLFIVIAE